MDELRPLLAIVGLVVVVAGVLVWVARLRGWRSEWWERFFSPGRARRSRAAAGESAGARSASGRPGRARSSPAARAGEADRSASGRQTLIDLDFLPLLDPEDAVQAKAIETGLDREFDVGDLGSVEMGGEDAIRPPRARAAPAAPERGETERARRPGAGSGSDRRADSRRRGPSAGEVPRAGSGDGAAGARGEGRELLVVLTILTRDERDLAGPVVREALAAYDLSPDERGMFHHYGSRRRSLREPVFSVANVLEPGVFDLDAMDELATPGLCLFMHRPGPLPATVSFDLMLDVGSRLARTLEAVLCDDQRCRLTVQATQALRERVVHFALRHERGTPNAG